MTLKMRARKCRSHGCCREGGREAAVPGLCRASPCFLQVGTRGASLADPSWAGACSWAGPGRAGSALSVLPAPSPAGRGEPPTPLLSPSPCRHPEIFVCFSLKPREQCHGQSSGRVPNGAGVLGGFASLHSSKGASETPCPVRGAATAAWQSKPCPCCGGSGSGRFGQPFCTVQQWDSSRMGFAGYLSLCLGFF